MSSLYLVRVASADTFSLAFTASTDHASVTSYTARVYAFGETDILATQALGKPTPDGSNIITVDLTSTMAGLSPGRYTVTVLTTSAGGSTESVASVVVRRA